MYLLDYASVSMHRRHMVVGLYLCIMYVCNSHFSKNQALANAVQAQRDNISNLIVLDF